MSMPAHENGYKAAVANTEEPDWLNDLKKASAEICFGTCAPAQGASRCGEGKAQRQENNAQRALQPVSFAERPHTHVSCRRPCVLQPRSQSVP